MKLFSAHHRTRIWFSAMLLGACLLAPSLEAQPVTTITANPNAQRLHEIWRVRGRAEQELVGNGAGGLGDINGDAINDLAVRFYGQWRVFYGRNGAPSDSAVWRFNSSGDLSYPIVGDFYGTGHNVVGFPLDSCVENGICLLRLFFFRTESGQIPDTAAAILDTKQQFCSPNAVAADLDGDGADELILTQTCYSPEIRIYKGGPNFQIDSPTVVIHDPTRTNGKFFAVRVGDFDHDGAPDILTCGFYTDSARLKFYWGSKTSPLAWSLADRVITLSTNGHPRINNGPVAADLDGDHFPDLFFSGPDGKTYLYRSKVRDKSARSRPFTLDDADNIFFRFGFTAPVPLGYLNDSAGRFAMMGVTGPSEDDPSTRTLLALSGGPDGPDSSYDALYNDGLGNLFGIVTPVGDVSGDGWPDLLCANPGWYITNFSFGVAAIISGGPYIPRDSSTSSVRDIALESHANALSIWPMPAHDVLNIAWRGDLQQMPHRFEVHDMMGRLIAEGEVDPSRGSALWNCADAPAGSYLLSVFDQRGKALATTQLLKL